jgi:phospholipase A1
MMSHKHLVYYALTFGLVYSTKAFSEDPQCFVDYAASLPPETAISEVFKHCAETPESVDAPSRLLAEKATEHNSFVLTPHRQNYILPFTHNANPNQKPWEAQQTYPNIEKPVQHKEAKLQLSLKVPLNADDLIFKNDGLYFGFTLKSFWQVYNSDISAPFRETNYRPEVFYQTLLPFTLFDSNMFTRVGMEHESNGRSQLLSRSWNRAYVGVGLLNEDWALYIQPWYRLPEDEKEDDGDPTTPPVPEGDDNPNIDDFMGYFELSGVYNYGKLEFTGLARNNFSTGNGAVELGMSFPLWGRLQGYIQYFNGYGESMIDYDQRVNRIGLGILLTGIL